jgi:uncharacterized protein
MDGIALFALQTVTLAVMMVGLLGLIIPILPGLTIIWISALVYWLVIGITWPSGIALGIMTIMMLGGNIIDNVFMGASARVTGASWLAIGIALMAGIIGSIAYPPFGGLIAALLALFIYEFIRLKDVKKAWQSTLGLARGCGWAALVRGLIGIIMIGMWLLVVFLINK